MLPVGRKLFGYYEAMPSFPRKTSSIRTKLTYIDLGTLVPLQIFW